MFAAYTVAFLIAIMAFADLTPEMRASQEASRGGAVALQMGAWHQAALKRCRALSCPAGTVNPTSHLPDALQPPTYSGRFRTASNGSGLIVTYYIAAAAKESGERAALPTGLSKHFSGHMGAGPNRAHTHTSHQAGAFTSPLHAPTAEGGLTLPDAD